ncbi:MAG: methyltransferase domain-containing protein [Bacteroidota bacterium]
MQLRDSAILDNLHIPGITLPGNVFEKRYIACRYKEKRIYTDDEVMDLPVCLSSHPHYTEWNLRKRSFEKLYGYLTDQKKPLNILEIGCGNGWLCHRLSSIPRSKITGLDINFTEIQQAARVFNGFQKIKFVYGDIRSGILYRRHFDIILFAASIQYFPALDEILELSLEHLTPSGEIHVTDSRFYNAKTLTAAKQRSYDHFRSIGFPEMADHYFHHKFSDLDQFNYKLLYDPHSLINRFRPNPLPFPWIRIKKDPF